MIPTQSAFVRYAKYTGLTASLLCLLAGCGSGSNSNSAPDGDTIDIADNPILNDQAQFLLNNAARDGVVTTASGLQYEVTRAAEGASPGLNDFVTVHYQGELIDGTIFDSSYQRGQPATFPVTGVIQGWVEALQLMTVGSQYRLVIPPELAYGESGSGNLIGPGTVLIFDVELLEINSG